MKRKIKHIIPLILLVLLTCSSCQYFFEPAEYYFSDIKTEKELVKATNSVNDLILKYFIIGSFQNSELFGDDQIVQVAGGPYTPLSFLSYSGFYDVGTSVDCVKGFEKFDANIRDWSMNYKTIASINNILSQFRLEDQNGELTKQLLSELIFYRAYLYYRLTLIYGRIPIITDNEINYSIPRSSHQEVYEFIENELQLSLQYLPSNKSLARIPYDTPDRGCAKALLGEVYLSWAGFPVKDHSKYFEAAQILEEVIDSAGYYGYGLVEDFIDLWSDKNQYQREAVFCKEFDRIKIGYSLYTALFFQNPNIRKLEIGVYGSCFRKFFTNPSPEINFYNNYPKGYRKDITFFTQVYVDSLDIWNDPEYIPEGLDTGYFQVENISSCFRAHYQKFFIDTLPGSLWADGKSSNLWGCPRIYLIRYAQTLLSYSEAVARMGDLNEKAFEYVNMIRRRARNLPLNKLSDFDLPTGLTPEAFADSVVQERAWELAGEPGHRWFDMVRLEIVEKVYENKHPDDGGPFEYSENDKYFFQIPESETLLNPSLKD